MSNMLTKEKNSRFLNNSMLKLPIRIQKHLFVKSTLFRLSNMVAKLLFSISTVKLKTRVKKILNIFSLTIFRACKGVCFSKIYFFWSKLFRNSEHRGCVNNLSSEDIKYCQNHSLYFGLIDITTVLLNDYKAKFLTGLIFNFLRNRTV